MSYDSWPADIKPSEMRWQVVANSKGFASKFTGAEQVVAFPGDRWDASLTFRNLTDAKYRRLSAFIASRRGMSIPFWVPHWIASAPLTGYAGAIAIATPGQTGTIVRLGFAAASDGETVLAAGDFIQIGDLFNQVVTDAVAGADLEANVELALPHYVATSLSDTVVVSQPACLMRLADNDQGNFAIRRGVFANVTIKCKGVLL